MPWLKRNRFSSLAAALLLAAAVLLICTKSSPLYPINDWSDANIYLSIGKGMTRGQVMYRDLYDHKGPLLYALHALCALLSFSDFTGVFLMEILFAAAFVYLARTFFERGGAGRLSWALSAVLALIVYTSRSFAEGDSAEELALPLILATLVGLWPFWQGGQKRMAASSLAVHGALAGCVFWIKFTMVGLHAGLFLTLLLTHLSRREGREALRAFGWLLAGFGLATLPWVLYFGANGAVGDWLKTYLYDNLFLYAEGEAAGLLARGKVMARCGLSWFTSNLRYSVPMLLGLLASFRFGRRPALACWLMAGLGALGAFAGGKSYVYYGLVLAPACVPGLLAAGRWLTGLFQAPRWLPAAVCALCVALCPVGSPNPNAGYGCTMLQPRETTMQYQVAGAMEQGATLLNYGFMDAGFFTASGKVPTVKYFHQTNVPLAEMKDEQFRYIEEGVCDYVVACGNEPSCIHEHYEAVLSVESPNFWYKAVTLYRRKH